MPSYSIQAVARMEETRDAHEVWSGNFSEKVHF
jgi:hypothetical protein